MAHAAWAAMPARCGSHRSAATIGQIDIVVLSICQNDVS
jgi:hypothetical protein